jgi:hypothetical protein
VVDRLGLPDDLAVHPARPSRRSASSCGTYEVCPAASRARQSANAAPAEQARRCPGRPRAVLSRGPGGGDPAWASRQDRSAHRARDGGRRSGGRSGSPAADEGASGRQAHGACLVPARPVALVGSGPSSPEAAVMTVRPSTEGGCSAPASTPRSRTPSPRGAWPCAPAPRSTGGPTSSRANIPRSPRSPRTRPGQPETDGRSLARRAPGSALARPCSATT